VTNGTITTQYAYDGLGRRVSQTVNGVLTRYLLDVQPELAYVLAATTGANTERYVHGPMGIHAQQDNAGAWDWVVQDGLGSVRGVVDNTLAVQESRMYDPYGNPFGVVGTNQTVYGFTGEQTDENKLLHLRKRYMNPALGAFVSLDPFEGATCRPMSLNGYSWVEGNPINSTDPSGMIVSALLSNPVGAAWQIAALLSSGFCSLTDILDQVSGKPSFRRSFISDCLCPDWITASLVEGVYLALDGKWHCPCGSTDFDVDVIPNPDYEIDLSSLVSSSTIQDLRRRCIDLDLDACNELSRLCDQGIEDACQALADAFRGNCSPWTYVWLREAQKTACDTPRACEGRATPANCADWAIKIANGENCVKSRENVRDTCYNGKDDDPHVRELERARRVLAECRAKYLDCPDTGSSFTYV
jgi:RHS repeat-associated protein